MKTLLPILFLFVLIGTAAAQSQRARDNAVNQAQRGGQSVQMVPAHAILDQFDSLVMSGWSGGLAAEGATKDGIRLSFAFPDPTTNQTITFPNATGTVQVSASEVVTATNAIAASETGSVFYLNSATEFVSTLPAPALGLRFTFIVTAAPSGASYTIVTTSSSNVIKGQQLNAAGVAGDTGTADDTISFVDGQAVAGDIVEVWSDGTSWFVHARCAVAAGITFTQAS